MVQTHPMVWVAKGENNISMEMTDKGHGCRLNIGGKGGLRQVVGREL